MTGELYGQQICCTTRLGAGTIYPLLARLSDTGWITSRREDQQDHSQPDQKLPARRNYHKLAPDGLAAALHELSGPQQPSPRETPHR